MVLIFSFFLPLSHTCRQNKDEKLKSISSTYKAILEIWHNWFEKVRFLWRDFHGCQGNVEKKCSICFPLHAKRKNLAETIELYRGLFMLGDSVNKYYELKH